MLFVARCLSRFFFWASSLGLADVLNQASWPCPKTLFCPLPHPSAPPSCTADPHFPPLICWGFSLVACRLRLSVLFVISSFFCLPLFSRHVSSCLLAFMLSQRYCGHLPHHRRQQTNNDGKKKINKNDGRGTPAPRRILAKRRGGNLPGRPLGPDHVPHVRPPLRPARPLLRPVGAPPRRLRRVRLHDSNAHRRRRRQS